VRVEASVVLPAPRDKVWRRLLAWELQPLWMSDAASVRVLTPHREGPGVRVAVRTMLAGVPAFTEVLEVTVWDPPRRMELAHRGFVPGFGEWILERDGNATRFRWTERLSLPVPVLGEAVLLAYRPVMRRLMRASLRNLADWLAGD
jgi:uncharacterized protein YndB with AHSA1/START domain